MLLLRYAQRSIIEKCSVSWTALRAVLRVSAEPKPRRRPSDKSEELLTGGSAAAYWAPNAYQSADADFVLTLEVDARKIVEVMQSLDFRGVGGTWVHPRSVFTVEFPRGPLAIGGELINRHETLRRADGSVLHVLSPQDSVRDRLAHFIHWHDRTALRAAVGVAAAHRDRIAIPEIERWAQREEPQLERFGEFVRSLGRLGPSRRPRR